MAGAGRGSRLVMDMGDSVPLVDGKLLARVKPDPENMRFAMVDPDNGMLTFHSVAPYI